LSMGLKTYYEKRDFKRTPEPRGQEHRQSGFSFVVQKHAATRLHYDFRLELEGVLKSWAVPKGPSFDPKEKRLAVHVEDHPVEYGSFEGIIPKDEYGGGTVMIWDRGDWVPLDPDPGAAYRKGIMKFRLEGEKLHGAWTLIRMKPKAGEEGNKENWLLIKERDQYVRPVSEYDVTEKLPDSIVTGRSLKQIAEDRDDVWHSEVPMGDGRELEGLTGARKGKLPGFVAPQLATLVEKVPSGRYLHEIKLDGYRELCRIDHREIRFLSRNGKDWTERFASLVADVRLLPVRQALLDGEVVALLPDGRTSFQALQNLISEGSKARLVYYVFDVLYLEGSDLRGSPLVERKRVLARLLSRLPADSALRFADHFEGDGEQFYREACKHSLEGIISKRAECSYRSGRTRDWLKVKCSRRQEFVIGGYTEPSGGRKGLGALLLGLTEPEGSLVFAGRVGTGFTERSLKDLHARLKPLEVNAAPFRNPPRGAAAKGVHWVKPELVAEVAFAEWTKDGQLRHPSFQGLRQDKAPEEVVIERPDEAREAVANEKEGGSPAKGGRAMTAQVAGIRMTNPERLQYPEAGISKRDLAEYYEQVADWILPHVKNRPLTLIRCPDGWNGDCFFQKHIDRKHSHPSVKPVPIIEESGKKKNYLTVDSLAGLIFQVQMGVLEFHPWGARVDDLERPDRMIFDLDPDPEVDWGGVVEAAKLIRELLSLLKLESYAKTTGGKGLHVVVPLQRRNTWEDVKSFSRAVVERLVELQPEKYTGKVAKAARKQKIYLDYLRNSKGANAIASYSTRAKAGAPVAVPIRWEELETGIRSDNLNLTDVPKRLKQLREDPWEGFYSVRQSITAGMRRKLGLL
jgi:bifunctional non-homologous end joining protein LigD